MTRRVGIVGHRGARGLFPENTLQGFTATWAMGVTAFELDVGLTRDGVVVVHHDLLLNPDITRDASGRFLPDHGPAIHDLTFAALQTYDVGRIRPASRYRMAHRAQKAIDGARVPTLDTVLRACPDARFIIELKTDPRFPDRSVSPEHLAEAALGVVDAVGAAGRVTFEGFDWRGPRHIRRLRPEIPLAWLTREETVRDAPLWLGRTCSPETIQAAITEEGGGIWAPAWDGLTRAAIDEAHRLGLLVVPWTVNRLMPMRRLIRWGVDGLITDRPDRAFAALQSAML